MELKQKLQNKKIYEEREALNFSEYFRAKDAYLEESDIERHYWFRYPGYYAAKENKNYTYKGVTYQQAGDYAGNNSNWKKQHLENFKTYYGLKDKILPLTQKIVPDIDFYLPETTEAIEAATARLSRDIALLQDCAAENSQSQTNLGHEHYEDTEGNENWTDQDEARYDEAFTELYTQMASHRKKMEALESFRREIFEHSLNQLFDSSDVTVAQNFLASLEKEVSSQKENETVLKTSIENDYIKHRINHKQSMLSITQTNITYLESFMERTKKHINRIIVSNFTKQAQTAIKGKDVEALQTVVSAISSQVVAQTQTLEQLEANREKLPMTGFYTEKARLQTQIENLQEVLQPAQTQLDKLTLSKKDFKKKTLQTELAKLKTQQAEYFGGAQANYKWFYEEDFDFEERDAFAGNYRAYSRLSAELTPRIEKLENKLTKIEKKEEKSRK